MTFALAAISLAPVIKSATALPLSDPARPSNPVTWMAAERWSPAQEQSEIGFHLAMPEGVSIREQYLYQEILATLLNKGAGQPPSVSPCARKVLPEELFGDFSLTISHPSLAMRLDCLRGVVGYILRQPVTELDFLAAREDQAKWTEIWTGASRGGSSLDQWAAETWAFRLIYQKYSPLYQIHSIGPNDFSDLAFDEFDRWLRRSREKKLITFMGRSSLLESLDLAVPDPMVLQPVTSLKSPRVPAGVLYFDGERFGLSALIMLSVDAEDPDPIDPKIHRRLSCNRSEPSPLGDSGPGSAIAGVYCDTAYWHGDVWLGLAARKSDGSSYQEFCRQVQELTKDADVAAVVHGSPEGSKGLYVLLPPACKTPE
ncbi:hypothetical protein [Bradyrhizobium sp.]|jgi:hypothetical protein|uniref:hypothetical protein n=1 Tax=Bradyrhizobium sp. TaxID=376 RepID=UPI003C28AA57